MLFNCSTNIKNEENATTPIKDIAMSIVNLKCISKLFKELTLAKIKQKLVTSNSKLLITIKYLSSSD